jgi:hypothetical protein
VVGRAGLFFLAAIFLCCEARAWNLDPWNMLPSRPDSYAIYNMSQYPVVVYHENTGARYVWAPGRLGYPSLNGLKLRYRPAELSVAPEDPSLQCTVRLVNYDCEPTLVIESGQTQTAAYTGGPLTEPPSPLGAAKPPFQVPPKSAQRVTALQAKQPASALYDRVRSFMERMVHTYIRFDGTEQVRRLNELKVAHRDVVDNRSHPELAADLEQYESLCRCVHAFRLKGMSPDEIYARRLCGRLSTREARTAVLARVQAGR